MERIEAALLPIEAPVLPQGRKELRIVTPGQLRVVAESLRSGKPCLVACMNREEGDLPVYPVAAQVQVVDFYQLEDDTLSIVVEGLQKVRISDVWAAPDGVWMGKVLPMPNWPSRPLGDNYAMLGEALKRLYDTQPDLADLYSDLMLEDACWVSQRWLEVLPLMEQEKQMLMEQPDCRKAMQYVMSLILSHRD
ncbi:LON peptidase substrate-binding domain-containing protein [Ferrimonas marina]|uniref:Lon protease N-terminal domain-containing protein n=1 Tax=Ferrimonas marina TaxID=299255 RepID=A0A1M5XB16_9GAMM|nr:LON peptidase substrate-binding domain-containing protein [Ferrimonas marina]SHH97055.1 Lon protease N-terminal domain-containing protein [Ferrimonas marina]